MKFTASLKTCPAFPKKSTGVPRSGVPPPPPPLTWPAGPLLMPPPYSITRASSHRAQAPRSARQPHELIRGVARHPDAIRRDPNGCGKVDGDLVHDLLRHQVEVEHGADAAGLPDGDPGIVAVDVEGQDLDD